MDLRLSDELEALRQSVHEFAVNEVAPVIGDYYARGEFPLPLVARMAEMGLFGLPFPEEYGGMGGDYIALCVAIEELAKVDSSIAITLEAGVSLGAMPIYRFGSEELKREWLPRLAAGEVLGAFGLTEPGAGSDAGGTSTPGNFKADLAAICNTSYGTMPLLPRDGNAKRPCRRDMHWRNSSDSAFIVVGNRGVQDGITNGTQYTNSKTLEIHGAKNEWEGNMCYNDGHVKFEKTFYPEGTPCVEGSTVTSSDANCPAGTGLDNIFLSETESASKNRGDILLNMVKAVSGSPSNLTFQATWD